MHSVEVNDGPHDISLPGTEDCLLLRSAEFTMLEKGFRRRYLGILFGELCEIAAPLNLRQQELHLVQDIGGIFRRGNRRKQHVFEFARRLNLEIILMVLIVPLQLILRWSSGRVGY